jgi:16S rRNA (cytosine967-C5)-methyltransferase
VRIAAYGIVLVSATKRKSIDRRLRAVAPSFEERDRRFLWTLTQETVRWQARLDAVLVPLLRRPLYALEPSIQVILRLAACQTCLLDTIPDHAIVDEGVRLARQFANPGAERLVNAVSRRLVQDGRARWESLEAHDRPDDWPMKYSHPSWLVRRWRERWGDEGTRRVLEWDNQRAPVWLRSEPGGPVPQGEAGWVPQTYQMPDGYRPAEDPAFQEGQWTAQDPSETLVSLLPPETGEGWIVDLCAAPGTKTSHLVSRFRARSILAIDRTRSRVGALLKTITRTGGGAAIAIADGEMPPLRSASVGGILIDAPCSALGVLRRRVDARWNVRSRDLRRLARQQIRLLRAAAPLLRRGGWLLYSVCSTEPEETDQVRQAFLAGNCQFRPRPFATSLPAELEVEEAVLRIVPGQMDCDGVYACMFECVDDR